LAYADGTPRTVSKATSVAQRIRMTVTPSTGRLSCASIAEHTLIQLAHSPVLLAEWRRWWAEEGEAGLMELLCQRWDPFTDESFKTAAAPDLAKLVRQLHEGASLVDVARSLNELRRQYQPERRGQKW